MGSSDCIFDLEDRQNHDLLDYFKRKRPASTAESLAGGSSTGSHTEEKGVNNGPTESKNKKYDTEPCLHCVFITLMCFLNVRCEYHHSPRNFVDSFNGRSMFPILIVGASAPRIGVQ